MQFAFTVEDQTGQNADLIPLIANTAPTAGTILAGYLAGTATTNVTIRIDTTTERGGGGASSYVFVEVVNGINVFQHGATQELIDGRNGGAPDDIIIHLNPTYLRNVIQFDATLDASNQSPTRTDFVSVIEHELIHGFAFNGWRDWSTGQLPGNFQSTFDRYVDPATFTFRGAWTLDTLGAVPLTHNNLFHYGNTSDIGTDIIQTGMMNGVVFRNGYRYALDLRDLVMMLDVGVPLQVALGTAGNDILAIGSNRFAVSGAGDDSIAGSGAADILGGGTGNDIMTGGAGADALEGGLGRDVAIYSIQSTAATWVRDAEGTWTVTAGADGIDTVRTVELLRFTDRDVSLQAIGDYTGNGTSDILLRNANSGLIWEFQMDGTSVAGQGAVHTLAPDWRIEGIGDFNGDGRADIVLHNISTGLIWEYQMNGTVVVGQGAVATAGAGWTIEGIGDFNGDARADILLRHAGTGMIWEYQMDGTAVTAQGGVATIGSGWAIEAIGDFNGDGRDDILLHNSSTGMIWQYQMNGTGVTGQGSVATVGSGWTVEGVGDFNGNGRDDILLHNSSTGMIWEYQMNGTAISGQGQVATLGLDWQITGTGDLNGDGRDDIVLHNSNTGLVWEYHMNGLAVSGQGAVTTLGADWHIV